MTDTPIEQAGSMAFAMFSNADGKASEIKALAERADRLTRQVDFWNAWTIAALVVAALAAAFIMITTGLAVLRAKQLSKVQSKLIVLKEAKLQIDLRDKDEQIAQAQQSAAAANQKAAEANLELARLTGPPYQVQVIHGVATPDLTRGTKQLVLLTSDVLINLPKLPAGRSLTWTLIIAQDAEGQHQFRFSPQISGFGNSLNSPGHSKWIVNLLTDASGTVNGGLGGTFVPYTSNEHP